MAVSALSGKIHVVRCNARDVEADKQLGWEGGEGGLLPHGLGFHAEKGRCERGIPEVAAAPPLAAQLLLLLLLPTLSPVALCVQNQLKKLES